MAHQFLEFVNQNIGNIISSGAMLIAALSLWVTRLAFLENNRPYVTFNIEGEIQSGSYFFYFRNTGIRAAHNVQIHINPTPKSYAFSRFADYEDRNEYSFAYLAPNQIIRTIFDDEHTRYGNDKKNRPDNEVFDITITYYYKKKKFKDIYTCDISYLAHIDDKLVSNDLKKGFLDTNKHLERISKTLSKWSGNV